MTSMAARPGPRPSIPVMAALAGGTITALAFAPTRWFPLVVVGPALGLWAAARSGSARRGALAGLVYGLAFAFVEFRWMREVDLVAGVVLPLVQGPFWAVVGAAAGAATRMRPAWWIAITVASWALVEATRARVPLTGFEWGQLSMAVADTPLRAATAVTGALGLTALLAAAAAVLAAVVLGEGRRVVVPGAAVIVLLLVVVGVGRADWTAADGDLRVGVVQVDDPCPGAFAADCPGYSEELLRSYIAGTRALDEPVDLLLWGEDALLGAPTLEQVGAQLVARSGELPAPLLAGAGTPTTPGRFLRWAALFGAQGTALDGYAKRMPVPFGEYVPWRSVLGGISDVGRLVPSDLEAGQDASPIVVRTDVDVARLGTVVSWEVTFARAVRAVARDANALATLTTVSSYGTSAASDQLLDAAQLRAAEHQKAMVVAAVTGRSALIDPAGGKTAQTALFEADRLIGRLPLRTGLTPYARFGDMPVVLVAVATVVAALVAARRGRSAAIRQQSSEEVPTVVR